MGSSGRKQTNYSLGQDLTPARLKAFLPRHYAVIPTQTVPRSAFTAATESAGPLALFYLVAAYASCEENNGW